MHAGGPPPVAVIVIAAEGGHLHLRQQMAHQHHAEMRTHTPRVRKEAHNAVGAGVRRHIEILRFTAQQQVAYASTHQIRLVAGMPQLGDNLVRQLLGFHVGSLPYANMVCRTAQG
jgi:hypothetical protein